MGYLDCKKALEKLKKRFQLIIEIRFWGPRVAGPVADAKLLTEVHEQLRELGDHEVVSAREHLQLLRRVVLSDVGLCEPRLDR